jgi:hypothetical protein
MVQNLKIVLPSAPVINNNPRNTTVDVLHAVAPHVALVAAAAASCRRRPEPPRAADLHLKVGPPVKAGPGAGADEPVRKAAFCQLS